MGWTSSNQPAKNRKPLTDLEKRRIDLDLEKVRRGGLKAFTKLAWPHVEPGPLIWNWHLDVMLEALEASYSGQIPELLLNVPPGCGKSINTCVFGPVWQWIQAPSESWMFTSFDAKLTHDTTKFSRNLIWTDWFKDRWGDRVSIPDNAAEGEYATVQGGKRFATSVGGKATGRHPTIIVVDDPLKPEDVTKAGLDGCRSWWSSTMATRGMVRKNLRAQCIMQRLHHADLAAYFIELGWEHIAIPMEFEKARIRQWSIPTQDPRTEEGELMWPELLDQDKVDKLKLKLRPLNASAQLQQNPSVEGGSVFKREWFQPYDPFKLLADGTKVSTMPTFDTLCQSWDCTFKGLDDSDFVVGQVWGRKGSRFYLLDEVRKQMSFSETCKAIRAMKLKWPNVYAIVIEDKANGSAVEDTLKQDVPGIVMVDPRGGKESRANAVSAFFEAKNVFHPNWELYDGSKDAEAAHPYLWVQAHQKELEEFPTATHDDRVDACSQALLWLASKRTAWVEVAEAISTPGGITNPFM